METPSGDVNPAQPSAPSAGVLPYASENWAAIVRDARRIAWRQGLIAALAGFFAALLACSCAGVLMTEGGGGRLIGLLYALLVLGALVLVPTALGALTYVGACRLTIERRCRAARICQKCGYDLRASESRCPECGKSFKAPAPTPPPA